MDKVALSHDGMDFAVAPSIGGSVLYWRDNGVDLLRPADADACERKDPLGFAAFPLFPFSGRIGNARFQFAGRDVHLAPNFPPEPHAIHGQSWKGAWRVLDSTTRSAHVAFEQRTGDWPWSYRAEQVFRLDERALSVELRLTNLSDEAMPAGIGWHPYFPSKDAVIAPAVTHFWPNKANRLPEDPEPLVGASAFEGDAVCNLSLDNCFSANSLHHKIRWPSRNLSISIQTGPSLKFVVIFTPAGEEFFCLEPVSHAPNAVNSKLPAETTGARTLQPQETWSEKIMLRVSALGDVG